jgi:hypothetical protein
LRGIGTPAVDRPDVVAFDACSRVHALAAWTAHATRGRGCRRGGGGPNEGSSIWGPRIASALNVDVGGTTGHRDQKQRQKRRASNHRPLVGRRPAPSR